MTNNSGIHHDKTEHAATTRDADQLLSNVKKLWANGQQQEAVNKCQALISAYPDHNDSLHLYALMLNAAGQLADAIKILKGVCEKTDASALAFQDLARFVRSGGNVAAAKHVMKIATERHPNHAPAYRELGLLTLQNRQPLDAIKALEQAIALQNGDWTTWHWLGLAFAELEKPKEAISHFDKALCLAGTTVEQNSPYYRPATPEEIVGIQMSKSDALNQAGRVADSQSVIKEILKTDPHNGQAWYALSNLMKFSAESPEIAEMEKLAKGAVMTGMPQVKQQYLNFALGKAWRDAGEPAKAMDYYNTANRLRRAEFNYDNAFACAHLQNIKERYPAECFKNLPPVQSQSDKPEVIFVIGMPRCGSTLTEQILASHPKAHGAGELLLLPQLKKAILGEMFPEVSQINPDTDIQAKIQQLGQMYHQHLETNLKQRKIFEQIGKDHIVVDKMLGNFMWVGLAFMALPNARFIHCRRNPVDTCLSCYTLRFSSGHPYSFDQQELGAYYKAYAELMEHWHDVVPSDRLLEVAYEDIVSDTETQAKRILDFAGLEWTNKVLDFHKTKRAVRTASFDQVNKPIYASSVERWKPYAPWIEPMLAALGPLNPETAS